MAVTVVRAIKTARRLGFTLDEVADLLAATRFDGHLRADAGLQAHAVETLAEIGTKLAELTAMRDTLCAALVGCEDLIVWSESPPARYRSLGTRHPLMFPVSEYAMDTLFTSSKIPDSSGVSIPANKPETSDRNFGPDSVISVPNDFSADAAVEILPGSQSGQSRVTMSAIRSQ